MKKEGNIGIFDSGIGGITVLKEIIKIMPQENYIYYSDSKNNPYGDKTEEEVKKICDDIVQKLINKNCKAIVIACNTASAMAKDYLREKYKNTEHNLIHLKSSEICPTCHRKLENVDNSKRIEELSKELV